MNIAKNNVVSIHYTLTNDGGETLDSSAGKSPLVYIQGIGQLIPGLENALLGKATGHKAKVTIPPAQAYGERNDAMIQAVDKAQIQGTEEIQVGMQFETEGPQGPMLLTVVEVKDTEVVLDGNHPLAGVTLHFDVEVVNVREASKEELDHGHVHGEGGHQH